MDIECIQLQNLCLLLRGNDGELILNKGQGSLVNVVFDQDLAHDESGEIAKSLHRAAAFRGKSFLKTSPGGVADDLTAQLKTALGGLTYSVRKKVIRSGNIPNLY